MWLVFMYVIYTLNSMFFCDSNISSADVYQNALFTNGSIGNRKSKHVSQFN